MIVEYRVEGMTCDHCVKAVSQEIGALPDVSDVRINLTNGVVTVQSGRALAFDDVHAAVDEAGYKLVEQL